MSLDTSSANTSSESPSSQYIQPLSNFIGNMVNVAREKVLGETWWIPSSHKAVVEIPAKVLSVLKVVERKEIFLIYETKSEEQMVYHLAFNYTPKGQTLSLFRCNDLEEARDLLSTYAYFSSLFLMTDSRKQLDSLMRSIKHHSLWLPVHIAAKLGMNSFFQSLSTDKDGLLFRMCQPEGQYPLHIALESCHIDLVLYMINHLGVPSSQTDVKGQTIFHYAARTNPSIISKLASCADAEKQINVLSKDGYTPLYLAVTSYKPTCYAALVKHGAVWDGSCHGRSALHQAVMQDNSKAKDLIKTLLETTPELAEQREPQTENSALHVASSKQVLMALLAVCPSIDLNMRNYAGQTALHLHAHAGNLACAIVLIYSGADLNAQDKNGDTCLHIAVSAQNLLIAKALLVVGADPNVINKSGDSARHVAAKLKTKGKELLRCLILGGAKPCASDHVGCTIGCSPNRRPSEFDLSVENIVPEYTQVLNAFKLLKCVESVKSRVKSGKKMQILLSLDGGGIRGLILVQILLFIESYLKRPLSSYIDWVAGTSTGSFVAVGLAQGKSLRECQLLYLRLKDVVFQRRIRPYDTDVMEREIKDHVGETTRLEDVERPKIIVTTVLADKHPVRLHIFRSYRFPGDQERIICNDPDNLDEMLLWQVLRCSSAAPTYFESFNNKFVDGGLISNNPSLDLLAEIELYNTALEYINSDEKIEVGCLLSIGTGRIPDTPIDCLNWRFLNVIDTLKNLGYMIMNQVTATEGHPVDRTRAWCFQTGVPFFRFSTRMQKDYVIDTKSDNEVVEMMWETLEYMKKKETDCALLADLMESLSNA